MADPVFPGGGGASFPERFANLLFCKIFAENCMKMKWKNLNQEEGVWVPGIHAPLDPPLRP